MREVKKSWSSSSSGQTNKPGVDHEEVGRYWNANADVWTKLSRAGYDVYRDYLNTPAFLEMLPEVAGLTGLDIGCGEGHNTRRLVRRDARMTTVDIAERFVAHARKAEEQGPLDIEYRIASAVELPFEEAAFDFATGFMSFMDVPEISCVLAEAYRVLRPGGFLQFSIEHPCFATTYSRNLRDERGISCAREVGDYFLDTKGVVSEWLFSAAPEKTKKGLPKFETPRFHQTVSRWAKPADRGGFSARADRGAAAE